MFFTNPFKTRLPDNTEALAGREVSPFSLSPHLVYGTSMQAAPEPDMEYGLKKMTPETPVNHIMENKPTTSPNYWQSSKP